MEEAAFFPEFFAMLNIETSDGLPYISEKEAVAFASFMFTEYQKKVLPPEQVKKSRKRPVVDQYIVRGSEPLQAPMRKTGASAGKVFFPLCLQ